jgi:hypothetical protein
MTEVLGRPVRGTVTRHGRRRSPQWEPEKFIELLDGVLTLPGVAAVKWDQYTPYFNDGDPCEFGIGEFYVRLDGIDEDAGEQGNGFLYSWDDELDERPDVKTALHTLAHASGHFEEFLEESFGDHAEITANATGFSIETCSHD